MCAQVLHVRTSFSCSQIQTFTSAEKENNEPERLNMRCWQECQDCRHFHALFARKGSSHRPGCCGHSMRQQLCPLRQQYLNWIIECHELWALENFKFMSDRKFRALVYLFSFAFFFYTFNFTHGHGRNEPGEKEKLKEKRKKKFIPFTVCSSDGSPGSV